MAKKRETREDRKKKATESICDLDNGFTVSVRSFRDLGADKVRSLLLRSRYAQILLSLTVIGAILRFYHLGYNSLWLDEATTYSLAAKSFSGIWEATTGGEFNPPLFYWIDHLMLGLGNSEVILRFVPALLGVLTIPLIYYAGKEIADRNAGLIAAAICTFSPFLIFYSQEARAYSLGLFLIAAALIVFLRAMKSDRTADWILFGLLSALAYWAHFYTLVVTGSLVLYAVAVRFVAFRKDIRTIKPPLFGLAVFAIVSLPLIVTTVRLFALRTEGGPSFGIQGAEIILETFRQLSGFSDIVMCLFLLLFVIGIVQAFLLDRNRGIFLVTLTVLPFVISWILSYRIPMVPRYLIILAPVYFIGIALAYRPVFRMAGSRVVVYGFLALVVLLSVLTPSFLGYYTSYSKEDWRGFSGQVSQVARAGDTIVFVPGYISQPFDYYYSNRTEGTFEYGASSAAELAALAAGNATGRVFYVVTGDISSADPTGGALAWLEQHAKGTEATPGIYLLSASGTGTA